VGAAESNEAGAAGAEAASETVEPRVPQIVQAATVFLSIVCLFGASDIPYWPFYCFAIWTAFLWLSILLHELGHAVTAWAVGWRIEVFVVGLFGFHVRNGDFAVIRRSKRSEFAGFVIPYPGSMEAWTARRSAWISAGGALANVAVALILACVAFAAAGERPGGHVIPSLIVASAALASLMVAICSSADFSHIRTLVKIEYDEWARWRALGTIELLTSHQTRLRDLPAWIVDEAGEQAAKAGDPQARAHHALLIGIVLDSPPVDLAQARGMLDEHRKRYGGSEWLDSCDAYFTAVWEAEPAEARRRLWSGSRTSDMKALCAAADAAVLAAEGEREEADVRLGQMRDAVRERSLFLDRTFRDIGRQVAAIRRG